MGRLLLLALVGLLVWRLLRRRGAGEAAVVGWADGSSMAVEDGAPEHDRLVAAARAVVGR
jgi:hypothetical protein